MRATRNAQSGALTFANLATDYDASQIGNDVPTLIVTTPAVFSIIERLVIPTVQVNYGQVLPAGGVTGAEGTGVRLHYGVNSLFYRGVPIITDEQCQSGNIWFVNENHLWLYEIDHDPLFVEGSKEGFSWSGWKKSHNQNAIVGQLFFAGQLVGDSSRTMSRRTGVTS